MYSLYIKKATQEDIPLIREIAETAFPATYKNILTPPQIDYMMEWMYSPEALKQQFEEGHLFFIALDADRPIGYVSIQKETPELFHLHKIYLLPSSQGKGAGSRLFHLAISEINRLYPGKKRVELNVNRYNSAVDFYRKQGMTILREGDFPIGEGWYMNDYIMGIDIDV